MCPPGKQPPDIGPLGEDMVSRLLRLGQSGPRDDEPVDELVERISLPGGDRWILSALASSDLTSGRLEDLLVKGAGNLDEIVSIKDRAKAIFNREKDEDLRLLGLAAYLLAIAAGLTHHGTLITRQRREIVDSGLHRLSAVMPSPWKELLERGEASPRGKGTGTAGKRGK